MVYATSFLATGAVLLALMLLQTGNTAPIGPHTDPGPVVPGPDFRQAVVASLLGLVLMVAVAFVLGWLISGRFLRPLRTITATAREISANNLHRRLGSHGRDDEFKELAETLDDLFSRLQASFESQRHFVANASHELRTPLTAERTLLQVALADPGATVESLRTACQNVLALGERQERLIEALLTLAGGERGVEHREAFDLAAITRSVVAGHGREAQQRDIDVRTALAAAPASGDASLVESLVANLVENALRHNVAGGRVEIAAAAVAGRAHLTVTNTGAVVEPAELDRLFEPFQRLGGERIRHTDGHGLGLAIVRAIAAAHGATLTVRARARPDGGLEIGVAFPDPA
jgi:signal transduction histidine kinase